MRTEKKMGAGILAICKNTGRILLGRRAAKGCSYPNYWGIFGGTFEESDENPKNTAKREFKEETNFEDSYEISKSPIDTRSDNFFTYYTYVGLFDCEFKPDINSEHADYGWFELGRLPDNMIPGLKDTIKQYGDKIRVIIDSHKKEDIFQETLYKIKDVIKEAIKKAID